MSLCRTISGLPIPSSEVRVNTALRPYLVSAAASIGILSLLVFLFALWANRDTSIYAAGYTESGFSKIREGMAFAEVQRLVGAPLSVAANAAPEVWFYEQPGAAEKSSETTACAPSGSEGEVEFDSQATVARFSGKCAERLSLGLTKEDVVHLLGEPSRNRPALAKTLWYTALGNAGTSRVRVIELDDADRVSRIIAYTTHD